ncbi:VanZ like family protein [Lentibacillus persicus]|uniref:VanZ like family protein n=1 Tax=Lentibacillus persicus TaxID=640948 RepID=A0A1I1WUK2_9BACI|nr:VanZ family protein [Lentibacillus persicus]SFD97123.1 VanZ like family protein [Lentibacillus persicus]
MLKYLYWLLPVGWMGVIFYSSAQPYENQDVKPILASKFDLSFLTPYLDWVVMTYHNSEVSIRALGIEGFVEFFMRKGAHLGVFFILMCLFVIALIKTSSFKWSVTLAVSFLLTIAYAAIDEFHQGFTANRTPYVGDVILDGAGALIALILIFFFRRFRTKKHST